MEKHKQRYFLKLSYQGTAYSGWQAQLNANSVQEAIEKALGIALQKQIQIVGCGRTDSGVHASEYFAHMELNTPTPEDLQYRLNQLLPEDIAIQDLFRVPNELHARFDACQRSYVYQIHVEKDPFLRHTSFYFPPMLKMDLSALQEAASILLDNREFFPFCKTKSDVTSYHCQVIRSEWEVSANGKLWKYHISSNRFLRGMVRLIVGMCLNVAMGKLPLDTVKKCLKHQSRLENSWSIPPQGLFLSEIKYDFLSDR